MRNAWILLAGTYLGAGTIGYQLAPREILDNEVKQAGVFTVDRKRVLSATVESLRAEDKLLVYSYKGSSTVQVERTKWWIFGGRQQMHVPATVGYFVDLGDLTLDKVDYNEAAKLVTVRLPPLILGDITFLPEEAQTINDGLLTWDQNQVDELSKQNYASARKAFVKQAQGSTLVRAAQAEAKANVQNYFEIPLRVAGQPDIKVVAQFEP